MSRCFAPFIALIMLFVLQAPAPAKLRFPHLFNRRASESAKESSTPASGRKVDVDSKTIARKEEAAPTSASSRPLESEDGLTKESIRTEPAVVETAPFSSPPGALYTTSDECG